MIDIPSHNNIEERIDVARRMKEEMEIDSNVEVLVDNMDDEFNKEFAAWPIRYFIAKDGKLLHKSDNSVENDLFDVVSIQNFFRGLGFTRVYVPKMVEPTEEKTHTRIKPNPPVQLVTKMAHRSSGLCKLMACCCSPCIGLVFLSCFCAEKLHRNCCCPCIMMAHSSSGTIKQSLSPPSEFDVRNRWNVYTSSSKARSVLGSTEHWQLDPQSQPFQQMALTSDALQHQRETFIAHESTGLLRPPSQDT